jgi:hypothetical protein
LIATPGHGIRPAVQFSSFDLSTVWVYIEHGGINPAAGLESRVGQVGTRRADRRDDLGGITEIFRSLSASAIMARKRISLKGMEVALW